MLWLIGVIHKSAQCGHFNSYLVYISVFHALWKFSLVVPPTGNTMYESPHSCKYHTPTPSNDSLLHQKPVTDSICPSMDTHLTRLDLQYVCSAFQSIHLAFSVCTLFSQHSFKHEKSVCVFVCVCTAIGSLCSCLTVCVCTTLNPAEPPQQIKGLSQCQNQDCLILVNPRACKNSINDKWSERINVLFVR